MEIQKAHDKCEAEPRQPEAGKDTIGEMKEELVRLCSDSKDLATHAVDDLYTNPPGKLFLLRIVDRELIPPQSLWARTVEEIDNLQSEYG